MSLVFVRNRNFATLLAHEIGGEITCLMLLQPWSKCTRNSRRLAAVLCSPPAPRADFVLGPLNLVGQCVFRSARFRLGPDEADDVRSRCLVRDLRKPVARATAWIVQHEVNVTRLPAVAVVALCFGSLVPVCSDSFCPCSGKLNRGGGGPDATAGVFVAAVD